ncbi:MAG: DUF2891 domain-containing protein [Opitutaceae bacterium]|nr:DUF2891 domain-containing protein [Opitutaceae bacterium]
MMSSASGLSRTRALQYARLGRAGIDREWPHAYQHLAHGPADVRAPRELHPAFYGCYDWHSSVHTHWMLARLRRLFPRLPVVPAIDAALDRHLTPANIAGELAYFTSPDRGAFERPYGWAWFLMLAGEARAGSHPAAQRWAAALRPLEMHLARAAIDWLSRLSQPMRCGLHPNTAFALTLMLDYARQVRDSKLEKVIVARSRFWYGADRMVPAAWEPGGSDFMSPALAEADLMRRILPEAEFAAWWHQFMPRLPESMIEPARPMDRTDPQFVHLDGLNLSRAWMLRGVAQGLPKGDPSKVDLLASAQRHAAVGLVRVTSGDYVGEHWLATFAVRLLT